MKRIVLISLIVAVGVYLAGCTKKEASLEESQVPMSMEALNALHSETQAVSEATKTKSTTAQKPEVLVTTPTSSATVQAPANLEPLPPQGPYKPTVQQIQAALKNAGFYTGVIDGKKGPLTKKAIVEFQKAKGLTADGKVGPKTWGMLSAYLNPAAEPSVAVQR